MPKRGTAHAGPRHRAWGSELAGARSSRQQSLCPGSTSSTDGTSSHHPQEHPGASVRLHPTSAGRQGDVRPRTAPPALPFPAALGAGCFQPGFSGRWAAFTDTDPEQERPGGGRGYLGCPVGKRLWREPSPRQVLTVQRAGLGLPGAAEAKIRARSSPTSRSWSRGTRAAPATTHGNWSHRRAVWLGLLTNNMAAGAPGRFGRCLRGSSSVSGGFAVSGKQQCRRQRKPPQQPAQFLGGSAVLRQRKCEGG